MSDLRLQTLKRAAACDPQARQAYVAAWLRAGKRDPRKHPRIGDVVRGGRGEEKANYVATPNGGGRWESYRERQVRKVVGCPTGIIGYGPVVARNCECNWRWEGLPGSVAHIVPCNRIHWDGISGPGYAHGGCALKSWRAWARDGEVLEIEED